MQFVVMAMKAQSPQSQASEEILSQPIFKNYLKKK